MSENVPNIGAPRTRMSFKAASASESFGFRKLDMTQVPPVQVSERRKSDTKIAGVNFSKINKQRQAFEYEARGQITMHDALMTGSGRRPVYHIQLVFS